MTQELLLTESVRTYERLLTDEIKNFPPIFFAPHIRKKRLEQLTRYLVENILQWTPEQAHQNLTKAVLTEHRLDVLLKYVEDFPEKTDDRAVKCLLRVAYPHLPEETFEERVLSVYEEVLNGTRRNFPTNYFHGTVGEERTKICVKHLCETILHLDVLDIPKNLTREVLSEYRLKILLNLFYDSCFDLITSIYPQLTATDFPQ